MSNSGSYQLGIGGLPITKLTGNSGGAITPTTGNINVVGVGDITVTGNLLTSTLTIAYAGMGGIWEPKSANFSMANGTGYICSTNPVVATLPVLAAVGDVYNIVGIDANTFQVAVNVGQNIIIGNETTTVTTGTITSSQKGDSLELLCVIANTTFFVIHAQGNFVAT